MWCIKCFSIILIVLSDLSSGIGQKNLIPNPSFEDFPLRYGVRLDTDPSYIRSNHQRPHTRIIINDYFNYSANGIYTIDKCNSGNNCVVLYNSASLNESSKNRSIIQGHLLQALEKDSLYYFSTYLCNSFSNPYNTEIPLYLLKDSVYGEKLPIRIYDYQKIHIPVERDSNWQKVGIRFKAKDNYKFFILGEVDEKAPKLRIPEQRRYSIQTVIDDLWLSTDSLKVPGEFQAGTIKIFEKKVFFDTGESGIDPQNNIISELPLTEDITIDSITIFSYTDGLGSEEANIHLSGLRSEAVRDLVIDHYGQVPMNKIRISNFGESTCEKMRNPDCRYSLLKIYYHDEIDVPNKETDSSMIQYLTPIPMPDGDTFFVINHQLDFKKARRKRDYRKAIEYTKQEKYIGKWGLLNERAEMWALLGECDSAMATLSLMLDKNPDRRGDWDFSNPEFFNCINDPMFIELRKKYMDYYKSDTILFPDFTMKLWNANIKDRGPYVEIGSHKKFPDEDSPDIIDSLRTLKKKYQLENEDLLLSIIDSIGWPTISKVGKTASTYAFMIVQHSADISFQQNLLDTMQQYALSGDIPLRTFPYLADRVSLRTTGKQKYGTQVLKQSDGSYKIAPYDDLDALIRNREKFQLGDWNAYLKRYGLEVKY